MKNNLAKTKHLKPVSINQGVTAKEFQLLLYSIALRTLSHSPLDYWYWKYFDVWPNHIWV